MILASRYFLFIFLFCRTALCADPVPHDNWDSKTPTEEVVGEHSDHALAMEQLRNNKDIPDWMKHAVEDAPPRPAIEIRGANANASSNLSASKLDLAIKATKAMATMYSRIAKKLAAEKDSRAANVSFAAVAAQNSLMALEKRDFKTARQGNRVAREFFGRAYGGGTMRSVEVQSK
jgi:hypothetical protein